MANPYYDPGVQRAEKVNDLFDRIAARYDGLNDMQSLGLHRLWKKRLVRLAAVKSGQTALDVCCGTGDIAFALAATGAQTTGIDFSQPMLDMAGRRKPQKPASNILLLKADALHLPFPDNSFDAVTVGYGLRNLADFQRGLAEMHRVARGGGRILVLDFGKPANGLWRSIYFAYLKCMVPVFGKLFCGDSAAYAYILESLRNYPAQEGVAQAMNQLGCRGVQVINLLGGAMSINYGEKA